MAQTLPMVGRVCAWPIRMHLCGG